ncbi:MAG: hypothetical protein PHY08_13265 [Candidatus Cloacimonetes bacterium]|nr:hypothetical protein [Candidatus Cloacimonadota bacterium]MDD4157528.1 hypothetical protein [Candidatus Cloacimonadota bacterium]
MTIYEVMRGFLDDLFPTAIITTYDSVLELTAFVMTYILIFGLIIIPLWKIATYMMRVGKR